MDQAHGGGRFVDVLPARAGGAEDLHLDILRANIDLGLLHLRKHGDRRRRGVDPAAGLGLRHALHTVDAGLELEARVRPVAVNFKIRFLHAAELRLVIIKKRHLPALRLRVHGVHPVQAVGKKRTLLAAHAAANFHNDAFLIVRIARQKQNLEFLLQLLELLFEGRIFLLTKRLHLCVKAARIQHLAQLVRLFFRFAEASVGRHDRLQPLLLAQKL